MNKDKNNLEAQKQFAADLVRMKHRAGQLGLYVTMHQLDAPLVAVGFEIAGDLKALERYKQIRS